MADFEKAARRALDRNGSMNEAQAVSLYAVLREAVLEAIQVVGIEGVRELSMFPSSKWHAKNDNSVQEISVAA